MTDDRYRDRVRSAREYLEKAWDELDHADVSTMADAGDRAAAQEAITKALATVARLLPYALKDRR